MLGGIGAGFALEREWVRYRLHDAWWRRIVGYLLALAAVTAVWFGLRLVLEGLRPVLLLRYVRYTLTGLWGGVGAPWLLVRVRLAATEAE
jgi:hypothetical protein